MQSKRLPWQDLLDAGEAGKETYMALLRYYLERDGHAVPIMQECPAAHALVEAGEAQWDGDMGLVPVVREDA